MDSATAMVLFWVLVGTLIYLLLAGLVLSVFSLTDPDDDDLLHEFEQAAMRRMSNREVLDAYESTDRYAKATDLEGLK